MSARNRFLRHPLKHLDDGPVAVRIMIGVRSSYQTLGAQGREMIANEIEQRRLATRPRLVTCH